MQFAFTAWPPAFLKASKQERDEYQVLHEGIRDLERLLRYEKRAWSRRKKAVRAFMAKKWRVLIKPGQLDVVRGKNRERAVLLYSNDVCVGEITSFEQQWLTRFFGKRIGSSRRNSV